MADQTAGSVAVEVRADIRKLLEGLRDGKAATEKFDAAVSGALDRTTKKQTDSAKSFVADENRKQDAQRDTVRSSSEAVDAINRETEAIKRRAEALRQSNERRGAINSAGMAIFPKYDPAAMAAGRYAHELEQINLLQKEGVITAQQAARYTHLAGKSYEDAARGMDKMGGAMRAGEVAGRALSGILAYLSVTELVTLATNSLHATGAIDSMAKQLGVSSKALQEFHYMAIQTGVSTGEMDQGLRELTRAISEGQDKTSRASKLLREFGFSAKEVASGSLTAEQVLPKLADYLKGVHDPALRARVLFELLGRSGAQLDPLLSQGSEGMNKLAQAANDLGIVLSADQIQNADNAAKKLDEVKMVLEADIAKIVADNAGAITALAKALGEIADAVLKFLGSNPKLATTLIGALSGAAAGFMVGGPWGALAGGVIGGAGGFYAGSQAENVRDRQDMTIPYRRQQLANARAQFADVRKNTVGEDGTVAPMSIRQYQSAQREVLRQTSLLNQAVKRAKAGTGEGGTTDPKTQQRLAEIFGPKGRQPGRSPASRNDTELARAEAEYKSALMQLTTDEQTLADLKKEQIDAETDQRKAQLDRDVTNKSLTAAEAEILKAKADETADLKKQAVDRDLRMKLAQNQLALDQAAIQNQTDLLNAEGQLATTAAERKRIALKILDNQFRMQQLQLESIIASETATETEKEIAREKLKQLDAEKKLAETATKRANASPLEAYINSKPRTKEEVIQAQQQRLADKATEKNQRAIQMADNLANSFGNAAAALARFQDPLDVATGLLQDLAQQFTQEFIQKPVSDWVKEQITPTVSKLTGANADPYGVTNEQLKLLDQNAGDAAFGIQAMDEAARNFAARLSTMGQSVIGSGINPLGTDLNTAGGGDPISGLPTFGLKSEGDFQYSLETTAGTADKLTSALQAQIPALGQFGSGLMSVLSNLSAGGGGGGGLFGSLLKIGGSLLGSAFGGAGSFSAGLPSIGAGVLGTGSIAESIPMFSLPGHARGGRIRGPGTGASDSILAQGPAGPMRVANGEFLMNARATEEWLPMLEGINSGRLGKMPDMGGMGGGGRGARSSHFQFGDIVLPGVTDERSGRRTAKQISATLQREMSRSMRQGYGHD